MCVLVLSMASSLLPVVSVIAIYGIDHSLLSLGFLLDPVASYDLNGG